MGWGWGCIRGPFHRMFFVVYSYMGPLLGEGEMGTYQPQFTAGTYVEVTILLRCHSEKKKTSNNRTRTIKNYLKFMIELDFSSSLRPETKRVTCGKLIFGYNFGIDDGTESKFGTHKNPSSITFLSIILC